MLRIPSPLRRFRLPSLEAQPRGLRVSALLLLSLPLVAGAMPLPPAQQSSRAVPRLAVALQGSPDGGSAATATATAKSQATATATTAPQGLASEANRYRITPERRALLNTIRYAEGTWKGGSPDGYRVIYGGGLAPSLDRHPEITVSRGYVSAAAGAYQFLPRTWEAAAQRLGLADFGPEAQDQAALHLIEARGALRRFDRVGLCPEILARLAPEWASLPGAGGGSYYGQPVKGVNELLAFYRQELSRQRDLARAGSMTGGQA